MEKTILSPNITLYMPPKKRFGGCHGVVLETGDSGTVFIDCNFPEILLKPLLKSLGNKLEAYFVTHFHMDHTAHVHLIEESTTTKIFMPKQESHIITDLDHLIEFAGIDKAGLANVWRDFGYKMLKFKPCKEIEPFAPGQKFEFGDIIINTIHLPGHSPGHVGFIIVDNIHGEKFLHVSDLGLDLFGPWYGFLTVCSLPDYFKSISFIRNLKKDYRVLLSSHTNAITQNFDACYNHITNKILQRENMIMNILKSSPGGLTLDQLSSTDLIFPMSKLKPLEIPLYQFWQKNFVQHHLQRLLLNGSINQKADLYSAVLD